MMETREAKLDLARKKLKDHQKKKTCVLPQESHILGLTFQQENNADFDPMIYCNNEFQQSNHLSDSNSDIELKAREIHDEVIDRDVNITEVLISDKTHLEFQIKQLESELLNKEHSYNTLIQDFNAYKQKCLNLENELKNSNDNYLSLKRDFEIKELSFTEMKNSNSLLNDQKNNFIEQLEFTKNILTAKEAENDSLHRQIFNIQNQYDLLQIQLQQLTNESTTSDASNTKNDEQHEALLQKVASLEQHLKLLQKDKDQLTVHYEHYVSELNDQLRSVIKKNEELNNEIHDLSNRETSLIDQISDMEIRLQNIRKNDPLQKSDDGGISELQNKYQILQKNFNELSHKYDMLQKQYTDTYVKLQELTQAKESENDERNLSITKLNADITSDKIAAQRATEQNKQLKQDIQGLEDAFVKMSKDKLELTEKLTAEKYLNRELTIKLAEVKENANDMNVKLKAKDEEMIRLQCNYREIEKRFAELSESIGKMDSSIAEIKDDSKSHGECFNNNIIDIINTAVIPKEDATVKLQQRFLKIMDEVANLSDEKHTLEHIILQLQTETDTICEYVALYQQQRSLLKKRDEERNAQIKIFQAECDKLKSQLDELSTILDKIGKDKELALYFEGESRRRDLELVKNLINDMKTNSLINVERKNIEFKNFYPCSCCSGQLIEV